RGRSWRGLDPAVIPGSRVARKWREMGKWPNDAAGKADRALLAPYKNGFSVGQRRFTSLVTFLQGRNVGWHSGPRRENVKPAPRVHRGSGPGWVAAIEKILRADFKIGAGPHAMPVHNQSLPLAQPIFSDFVREVDVRPRPNELVNLILRHFAGAYVARG